MELHDKHKSLIRLHGLALVGATYKEQIKSPEAVDRILSGADDPDVMDDRLTNYMRSLAVDFPYLADAHSNDKVYDEFSEAALKHILAEIRQELTTLGF